MTDSSQPTTEVKAPLDALITLAQRLTDIDPAPEFPSLTAHHIPPAVADAISEYATGMGLEVRDRITWTTTATPTIEVPEVKGQRILEVNHPRSKRLLILFLEGHITPDEVAAANGGGE